MQQPSDDVRAELSAALEEDSSLIGKVHRLRRVGKGPNEIKDELGYGSAGTIHDHLAVLRTILEGEERTDSRVRKTVQVAQALLGAEGLSDAARSYLTDLRRSMASQEERLTGRSTPSVSPTTPAAHRTAGESLRSEVAGEMRRRVETLIGTIKAETGLDPDDYQVFLIEDFPLDPMTQAVKVLDSSRTFRALRSRGRLDLTIEQGVLDWVDDLPIPADLVAAARGRLDYWRSS